MAMNEDLSNDPRSDEENLTTLDTTGIQYLKALCDRRDAAVLNPVAADQYLPDSFIKAPPSTAH
jgi:hypothetical protein